VRPFHPIGESYLSRAKSQNKNRIRHFSSSSHRPIRQQPAFEEASRASQSHR
jgi:hypothetical protein